MKSTPWLPLQRGIQYITRAYCSARRQMEYLKCHHRMHIILLVLILPFHVKCAAVMCSHTAARSRRRRDQTTHVCLWGYKAHYWRQCQRDTIREWMRRGLLKTKEKGSGSNFPRVRGVVVFTTLPPYQPLPICMCMLRSIIKSRRRRRSKIYWWNTFHDKPPRGWSWCVW